jgi:uncharacterized membrane protein
MISQEAINRTAGKRYNNIGKDSPGDNVGVAERWASMIIGGGLLLYGLSRKGILTTLAGGALVYRGAMGRRSIYNMFGIDTPDKRPGVSVPHRQGVKVEKSIIVNKSTEDLYRFWRNPENLPRFMSHVASVRALDANRSRWKMKTVAGTEVEWDAEIVNDKPNELIAWRTLEGADVDHAGSVHFDGLPGERGTKVKVVMEYRPPAGQIGVAVAKLFGEEPEQILENDLRRFKQLMETGDVLSTDREAQTLT